MRADSAPEEVEACGGAGAVLPVPRVRLPTAADDAQRRAKSTLGVIFVRLRRAEEHRHAEPRDRRHRAPELLCLADRLGQADADELTQVLGVRLGAEADGDSSTKTALTNRRSSPARTARRPALSGEVRPGRAPRRSALARASSSAGEVFKPSSARAAAQRS